MMTPLLRIAPLVLLPFAGLAQGRPTATVGLEVPAPAPVRGHFLTGAYAAGSYGPMLGPGGLGYAVQPFLRYQFGTSTTGRLTPFLQYTFTPYRLPAFGPGALYRPDGSGLPATAGFAPLAARNAPGSFGPPSGYGSLGAFSVGVPVHVGRTSAALNVGGSLVEGLLWGLVR